MTAPAPHRDVASSGPDSSNLASSNAASSNAASSPFPWPPVIFAVALLAGGLLAWAIRWSFLPEGFVGFLLRMLGAGIIIGAITLQIFAARRFRSAGTPIPPHKPTATIVTEGVYARTRNPMYLGFTLALIGVGILFDSVWFLIATPFAVLAVTKLAIEREERYLAEKFGPDYLSYKQSVRRWF